MQQVHNTRNFRSSVYIFFITTVIALIIFCFSCIINYASTKIPTNEKLKQYNQIHIIVQPNDTIWSLQNELYPDEDTRYILSLDKLVNSKNLETIYPGENIILICKKAS